MSLLFGVLLSAAGCKIELPSGRIACRGDADCPAQFQCTEYAAGEAGDRRCFALGVGAGRPASVLDAGQARSADAGALSDAGDASGADAGAPLTKPEDAGAAHRDAGRADAGAPDSSDPQRPTPDSGAGSPLGMAMLPAAIAAPLPACGSEPAAANAYFVSAGVGEDVANCGGPMGPCKSIGKALKRAQDDGVKFVYLDNTDVYTESDTLQLPASVIVAGGFSNVNGRWTRLCDAAHAKTLLRSSGNPALRAEYSGAAMLTSLSVETRAAEAAETMIGVFVSGTETQLWLDAVSVTAADGGAGVAGAPGAPGAPVSASCAGSDGADAATVGSQGADAVSGSFGATGYVASDGARGTDGNAGNAGATAPFVLCVTCLMECDCGAGSAIACGERGTSGCGGAAGGGGDGGHGGGSSVALYVWDAEVHVKGGSLQAGSGGNAGDGGAAGSGGVGALGTQGAGAACTNCRSISISGPPAPICIQAEPMQSLGTAGGNGGRGSDGGPGGAGAGGHAYAAYSGGASAKLTVDSDVALKVGQAGTGASGQARAIGP